MDKFVVKRCSRDQMVKFLRLIRPAVVIESALFGLTVIQMEEAFVADDVLQRWLKYAKFAFNKPELAIELGGYLEDENAHQVPRNTSRFNYFTFLPDDLLSKIVCECVAEDPIHALHTIPYLFPQYEKGVLKSPVFLKECVRLCQKMAAVAIQSILEEKPLLPWSSNPEFKKNRFELFLEAIMNHGTLSLPDGEYCGSISKVLESAKDFPFKKAQVFHRLVAGCLKLGAGMQVVVTLPGCLSECAITSVSVELVEGERAASTGKHRVRFESGDINRILSSIIVSGVDSQVFERVFDHLFAENSLEEMRMQCRVLLCGHFAGDSALPATFMFILSKSDFTQEHNSALIKFIAKGHRDVPDYACKSFAKVCLEALVEGILPNAEFQDVDWLPVALLEVAMEERIPISGFRMILAYLLSNGTSCALISAYFLRIKLK